MTKSIFDKVNDPPEEKSRDSGYSEFIDDFDFSNPVFFNDAASQDAVVDAPDAGFARVEPIIPESSGPIDRNVVKNLWDSFCTTNPHFSDYNLDENPLGAGSYGVAYILSRMKTRYGQPVKELFCVKFADDTFDPINAPDAPTEDVVLQAVQGLDNLAQIAVKPVRLTFKGKDYRIFITKLYDGALDDCSTSERFDEKAVIKIGIEIANGLVNLHSCGFYHRDVKPSNIFYEIEMQDGLRHYYLGDFGSCTKPPAPGEQTSRAAGLLAITPEYLDPKHEITRWDARIDLYALSSTMYWLLNNHQIKEHTDDFTDDNSTGVNFRLSSSRIRPTDVTNDLWRILARAMDCSDKFARIRYKSATEFKAALEKVLEDMCAKATNNASSIEDTNEESGILPQLKGFCYLLSGKKHCKKGNYRRAYELLEKAAKNGGAAAYVPMGDLFFHGLGVPRNNVRAYDCYQKVSELADPIGRNNLGFCYATSCGMSQKNEEVAYHHFAFAANDDLPAALYNKGLCCHIGFGTDADIAKALRLYHDASHKEISEAYTNLGFCHHAGGDNLPQSEAAAVRYYNLAAKSGNAEAEYNLATYYRTAGENSDAAKAFALYKSAASKGLHNAFFALYWCYKNAYGTDQDLDMAAGYLNLAKFAPNYEEIANTFIEGSHIKCGFIRCDQFVTKVPDFSIVNYLTSFYSFRVNTYYCLGYCFEKGICTEVDYEKALECYKNAVGHNSPEASSRLGMCYELGLGMEHPDLDEAFHYYSTAAAAGDPHGQFALGRWYESGNGGMRNDPDKAFKFYKRAAEQGHAEAQYHLALCYNNGFGCRKNLHSAFDYFRLAADQEFTKAQNLLGDCYYHGRGVDQDRPLAFTLFKKAAAKGLVSAMYNVGFCYRAGHGTDSDYVRAVESFKNAARGGSIGSLYELGYCYYHGGYGIEKDHFEAVHWLEKAVIYRNDKAAWLLGKLHEYPLENVVIPDYYKALCYYKLATKLGIDASNAIARCEKKIDNLFLNNPSVDTNKFSVLLNEAKTSTDIDSAIQWLIDSSAWRRRPRTPPPVTVPIKGPEQPRRKKTALHTGFMYYVLIAFLAVAAVYASYAGWIFPGLTHNVLGCLCRDGIILKQDPKAAFEYFSDGSDMGNARAQYNLGACYENSIGVNHDPAAAFKWYLKSAEQGHEAAEAKVTDIWGKSLLDYTSYEPANEHFRTIKLRAVSHKVARPAWGWGDKLATASNRLDLFAFVGDGSSYDKKACAVALDFTLDTPGYLKLCGTPDYGETWVGVQEYTFPIENGSGIAIMHLEPTALYDYYRVDVISDAGSRIASSSPFVFTNLPKTKRSALEERSLTNADTYCTSTGKSVTYIQQLAPANQDFVCEFVEVPKENLQIAWNSFDYFFDAASGYLNVSFDFSRNKTVYNTRCATFSYSPFTPAEIAEAAEFYSSEVWAGDQSNSQLGETVSLGIPFEDWHSDTAYILLLCMDKNFEVLDHIIIKASNMPVVGLPESDWVEIEGVLCHEYGIDLNVNYLLGNADTAELAIAYSSDDPDTWTVIDKAYSSIEKGAGKKWLRVDTDKVSEDSQLLVYIFPKERGKEWTPLASSQPVEQGL